MHMSWYYRTFHPHSLYEGCHGIGCRRPCRGCTCRKWRTGVRGIRRTVGSCCALAAACYGSHAFKHGERRLSEGPGGTVARVSTCKGHCVRISAMFVDSDMLTKHYLMRLLVTLGKDEAIYVEYGFAASSTQRLTGSTSTIGLATSSSPNNFASTNPILMDSKAISHTVSTCCSPIGDGSTRFSCLMAFLRPGATWEQSLSPFTTSISMELKKT